MGRSGKNLISKLISEAMAFVSNCAGMRAWLEKSIGGSWQGDYNSSQLLVLRSYDSVCAFTALGILLWPAPPCILPALSCGLGLCLVLRQTAYRITLLLPDVGTLPAYDIIILEWFFILRTRLQLKQIKMKKKNCASTPHVGLSLHCKLSVLLS